MIDVLRTPEERFARLPGFSFAPHYVKDIEGYKGLRMHYLDEGPREANQIFLCLHGEPTWSYLYRKMIPVFTAEGHRVVAPDLFGFGRSDKPKEDAVHTFHFHRGALLALIEHLDLMHITLVCQDWGGVLGLTLPMDMVGRFTRFLVMNTGLGTGHVPLSQGFLAWRDWANAQPDLDIGRLMARACPHLTVEECAAYEAPFPDASYKAGVRSFPNLVPDRPDAPGAKLSRRAREWLRKEWSGETFMAIGMKDPVLGAPVMHNLRKIIRGCPEPFQVQEAGHFLQEWGEEVAKKALESFN